ncbi:protein tyrosine phosphatase family protein [Nodosilinea sp. LEGE 06152]|uniref:protein tyrosine phosphatase family protein n=1 Tax=Nodosilinea sp. LEGE 06152 TaxID=2777966 RepID=UPI001881C97E|nr:protein tyrosine phosphatase family protein [Nodosilinea sp. LEGE 06152]MBE9155248.1 protein tyrosine phosphatase family protein [Nodosilinea sp. LEGE 06152]
MTAAKLTDIRNYLALSPSLATAGQPTPEQFEALAQAGYTVVINLALSTSDHAIPNEAELVKSLGMTHFHIPVVWEAPTMTDLEIFFKVMERNRDYNTLVHCALNMRVSAFVYLYRVLRQGVDEPTARADLHRIWQPNPTWQAFIDEALAQKAV